MATATTKLLLTILADDKASPQMKLVAGTMLDVGKAAEQAGASAGGTAGAFDSAGISLDGLSGKISKASMPLRLMSSELGGVGSGVAKAETQVAKFAMLLASGGVFGVALAAASAAVGAGVAVWKTYKEQAESVAAAVAALDPVMKGITSRLQDQKSATQSLADELRFYGKASRDVAIARAEEALALKSNLPGLKAQLAIDEQRLAEKRKEITATKEASSLLGAYAVIVNAERDAKINEYNAEVQMLNMRKQSIAASEADGDQLKKQISILKELKTADAHATEAKKARADATKEATDAEKKEEDQIRRTVQAQLSSFKSAFGQQARYYETKADLDEKTGKMADEAEEKQLAGQKKLSTAYKDTAATMGEAFGTGFAGLIAGQEGAGKQMVSSVVNSAMAQISAYAVTAAAGAASAEAGIPVVGPVLAAAAMAAMSALVMGLISQLPSFHTGGVVGADDGMRLPGMKSNERLVNALVGERFVAPGASGGGGGGSSVVINSKSLFAPTSADTKRMVNQVGKALRRQRRLGYAT